MKTICLHFEIHQNVHLKRYRFSEIGTDHYYYDDYQNEQSIAETVAQSYAPALKTLLSMTRDYKGMFKCAFSVSGVTLELLEQYAPEVIDLLQDLSQTGQVEFLAEPYGHGFSSIMDAEAFREETLLLSEKIASLFGMRPKVFANSCLMYSDDIGEQIGDMGFIGILGEGARHVLGWKSPHFLYQSNRNPALRVLLRDYRLSEDIAYNFGNPAWSEYPLYAETFAQWIDNLPEEEQVVTLSLELCALGIFQPLSTHILDFLYALPAEMQQKGITFSTPSEVCEQLRPIGEIDVEAPVTWVDEERDLSPWLGNVMQREALKKLYSIAERLRATQDPKLMLDWYRLQASNNFRFMNTKPGSENAYRGLYDSPYDAFTNYMNILADFITRVRNRYPETIDNEELNSLLTTIKNMGDELAMKDKEITKLRHMVEKLRNAKTQK